MHFCEGMDDSPAMIRLQAKHLQMSLESIADVFRGHDQELIAQVALWVVAGSFILPFNNVIPQYVVKACEAIDVAGLQFIPTYGRPPAFSDDLHEKLSLLCQAIYLENFVFLTHGGAEPTMTAGLEKEFRHRLQVRPGPSPSLIPHPQRFPIGRLSGAVQDMSVDHANAGHSARQGYGSYSQPSSYRRWLSSLSTSSTPSLTSLSEPQLSIWRQSCRQLVCLLDSYSQTLLFNLQRFQELGDKGGAGVIRSSCVCCLAHLAVLCKALGQPETLWDSALERLGELTGDMSMEEFTRLDLLLGVRAISYPPERNS